LISAARPEHTLLAVGAKDQKAQKLSQGSPKKKKVTFCGEKKPNGHGSAAAKGQRTSLTWRRGHGKLQT